ALIIANLLIRVVSIEDSYVFSEDSSESYTTSTDNSGDVDDSIVMVGLNDAHFKEL
ncbi:hypothetical protein PanWU01x14_276850, partial [Parasponia andersonii]